MVFELQPHVVPVSIGEIQFTFSDFGIEMAISAKTGEEVAIKPEISAAYSLTIVFDDGSNRRRSGLLRPYLTQPEIAGLLALFARLRQEATVQIIGEN